MAELILDINDCELRLWRDRDIVLRSPGYACLRSGEYLFGEAARAQARLHPRDINHRFWWQLNTEPLQPAFGRSRHSADLVHGHLLDIHQQGGTFEQVVLCVPGSMQQEQLALLLGIIEQCPFTVCGLVERAVVHASGTPLAQHCWHLELQLHQALLTELSLTDGHVQREQATAIPGSGWLAIQDSIANAVADAFIRQTRFDPRRTAATEQQLFDALPALLQTLSSQREYNLELGGHRARVAYDQLAEALSGHYNRLAQGLAGAQAQLLVDRQLSLLPGIASQLQTLDQVDPSALCDVIARQAELVVSAPGDLHFITSLPATPRAATASVAAAAATPATTAPATTAPATTAPATTSSPAAAPPVASNYLIEFANDTYTLVPGPGTAPLVNGKPVTQSRVLTAGDCVDPGNGQLLQLTQAAETTEKHGSQT